MTATTAQNDGNVNTYDCHTSVCLYLCRSIRISSSRIPIVVIFLDRIKRGVSYIEMPYPRVRFCHWSNIDMQFRNSFENSNITANRRFCQLIVIYLKWLVKYIKQCIMKKFHSILACCVYWYLCSNIPSVFLPNNSEAMQFLIAHILL